MSFQSDKENFIQGLVDRARGKKVEPNSTNVPSPHHNLLEGNEEDCPFLKANGKVKENTSVLSQQPLAEIDNNTTLDTTTSSNSLIPKGHISMKNGYTEEDKEKCPYFKMQKKSDGSTPQILEQELEKVRAQEQPEQDVLSSSSEDENGIPKRPKGGCPFLPSERKKNPGLTHAPERFSTYYLSRYACYLEQDNLMSLRRDFKRIIHSKPTKNRRIFEAYPIYLKHTLFYEDELMQKIRKKEIVERFLVYDKYRERGNRLFNKKKYTEALYLYERAFSCYRWLELLDSDEDEKEKEKKKKEKALRAKQEIKTGEDEATKNIFEETKENIITQRNAIKKIEEPEKKQQKDGGKQKNPFKQSKKFKEDKEEEEEEAKEDDKLIKKQKSDDGDDDECERDNEQEIQDYKQNDGVSQNKINDIIFSRQQDILEQEKQRQMMLQKLRKDKKDNDKNNEDANNHSADSRNASDFDNNEDCVAHHSRSEGEADNSDEEEDKRELERIAKANEEQNTDDDDKKSLIVEGFDDQSDRNFSSEEEEIDFEKLKEQKKNPDEQVIYMDEKDKERMVAEEMFMRQNEKEDKEFRKKYRLYLTNFTDQNIVLHDGEELTDSNDIDLRFSMLVNACLSMGTCYMMLGNFKEAMVAYKDARALHKKGSIPLFKMVQCVLYNKASTYLELLEAKEWYDQSVANKKDEKVFNSGAASLVVMNILNHETFYEGVHQKLLARIETQKEVETERLREMFERIVELNEIEQDMLQRGVTPAEEDQSTIEVREKEMEEELSQIIEGKYYTLIESQMYAQNDKKMGKYQDELQKYYETYSEVEYYKNLDFTNFENHPIMKELAEEYKVDMYRQKNQYRFSKLKVEYMKDTFNSVEYNFQIYKWALDEYIEKQRKKLDKTIQEQEKQPKTKTDKVKTLISSMFGKASLLQFFFIFAFFYIVIIVLRSQNMLPWQYGTSFKR